MTQDLDQLIASRGSASLLELGIEPQEALALVKKRPDLEPVFLVRFKSRQGKTRVEEVRAYAWPSQQIALSHLGYRAEDTRLLRLEPRQPVPFPARLYARFESTPKELEELRKTEKAYDKAMKQAASKPGRAEMELVPLIPAFAKLGSDVALEMLIETAGAYQRLDNPTYASKMLGNLLKLVEKNKKAADDSLLARTVLAASDDGVFNAKLYDFTWETLGKKHGVATALAFGVRVFRRLVQSGRALPTDFVKDMRKAAIKGKVEGEFARLFDETIVWAVGEASFWNTARRTSSWRDEETKDHSETQLLRVRFAELWKKAGTPEAGAEGAPWKAEVWGRLQTVMSELTSYGRTVLVETLLATADQLDSKDEAERLLEATLAMLSKAPRSSDRARVENVASKALGRIATFSHDLLWEKSQLFEEALRAATGDLTSFVALADLLSDLSESIPSRGTNGHSTSLLRSLPGLEAAWTGALVAALNKTEKPRNDDDDDDYDDDSDSSNLPPIVSVLGESLALLTPATASEHLAELGPLLASRLSKDLHSGGGLAAWGRVLGTLRALGPVGVGITSDATTRFVKSSGERVAFANAAEIAHLLDADALRAAAESRRIVDEALEVAAKSAHVPARSEKMMKPEKELGGDGVNLLDVVKVAGGPYHALWSKGDDSEIKAFAVTAIAPDLKEQTVVMKSDAKGAANVKLWATPDGTRVLVVKERLAQLFDLDGKVIGKLTLPEEFKGSWGCTVEVGERFAFAERSEHVIVFDHKMAVVAEIEGKGYGSWSFLDAKAPGLPVVVHQSYSDLRAIYAEGGKKLPDPKFPGFQRLAYGVRFEDGSFHIDYQSKKNGMRRARLVDGAWKVEPATPFTVPAVDACVWAHSQVKTWNQPRLAFACPDDDENYEVYDFNDQLLCGVENREDAKLIDLDRGVGIYPDVILVDSSVPVRMAASADLRAAAKETPAETAALPRPLYKDRARLAAHLKEQISARPAGQAAIAKLGTHAEPLVDSAAGIVLPLLTARQSVLESLERPAPTPSSVPPRVPGVRRTEIRRVVRELVEAPLDGLVFWAIDGADPGPVVEYLFPKNAPVSSDAWATALSMLGLAQRASTSDDLARRALDIADAIATALSDATTSKFKLEPEDYSYVEDDDDAAEGQRLPHLLEVERGSSEGIVNKPAGKYGKAALPMAWIDESDARQRAVHAWIHTEILGSMSDASAAAKEPKIVGKNEENTRIYRVHAKNELTVDVTVVFKKDTFKWELTSVAGEASGHAWGELLRELGSRTEALPGAVHDGVVWPARAVVLPAAVESLRRGIELTRANIARRESLRPLTWDAPDIKGVEDSKSARFVMLAWIHGDLRYEAAGTTRQNFEKIAKTCKIVKAGYYGLQPQLGKDEDHVGSPEFKLMRFTSLVAGGSDRDKAMENLIVLRDPAEIVAAFTKEIGPAAVGAKKTEKK